MHWAGCLIVKDVYNQFETEEITTIKKKNPTDSIPVKILLANVPPLHQGVNIANLFDTGLHHAEGAV